MKLNKTALLISLMFILGFLYLSAVNRQAEKYDQYLKRQRFEKCIESHPSDFVCDSCWNAIMLKK